MLKVRARVEIVIKNFCAVIFISGLLGLIDFSDIVMLGRPNSCYLQNLKCFDMLLSSLGYFVFMKE